MAGSEDTRVSLWVFELAWNRIQCGRGRAMQDRVWFLGISGAQHGPMPYFDVLTWIREGRVRGSDFAYAKGMADWKKLEEITAFMGYFGPKQEQAVAPPVPSPPPRRASSADEIDYVTLGSGPQVLEVTLDPGEGCVAVHGSLFHMDPWVSVEEVRDEGLLRVRASAGVTGAMELFENGHQHAQQRLTLSSGGAGKVLALDVGRKDTGVMVRADALFAWARGLKLEYLGKPLEVGPEVLSLGEVGWAFVKTDGVMMERELGVEEQVKLAPGSVLAWAGGARCDVARTGTGSVVVVTGPGKVWAQSGGWVFMCSKCLLVFGFCGSGVVF